MQTVKIDNVFYIEYDIKTKEGWDTIRYKSDVIPMPKKESPLLKKEVLIPGFAARAKIVHDLFIKNFSGQKLVDAYEMEHGNDK